MWSCDVAGGEDALDVRRGRAGLGNQVAGLVVVELVEEQLRVRVVTDRDEQPLSLAARASRRYRGPGRAPRSSTARRRCTSSTTVVRDELDLLVRLGAVEHDLRGAELVAPVDERHLGRRTSSGRSPPPSRSRRRRRPRPACRGRTRRRRRRSRRRLGPAASARTRARAAARSRRSRRSRPRRGTPSSPTQTRNGRSEKSTFVTSSVTNSAPKRSAWRRKSCIISGPMIPSG